MSRFTNKINIAMAVFSLTTVITLSGCSDDSNESAVKAPLTKKAVVATTIVGNSKNMTENSLTDAKNYQQMSKPLDKANWVEKGKFKKEFTKDCIAREVAAAGANKANQSFLEKTCACIADYMDNKLTDQEADEYLKEDNHVQAFKMRYDAGAYECLQESQKEEEPKITRFQ